MEASNWSMVYSFFSFAAGMISLAIAIYMCPHWKNKSARVLLLLMAALCLWSLAYGMEFISPGLDLKLWWVKIEYLGAVWVGMLFFCFVLTLTGRQQHLNKKGFAVLSIIPLFTLLLVLTNSNHHLMWQAAWVDTSGRAPAMVFERGTGFWGFILFSYGLMFLATLMLIHSLISARGLYKKQLMSVLIGVCIPWLSNMVYLFGFQALKFLDLSPAAFTLGGISFSWGLLRYQKLSLIPLAHEAVLASIGDPVIALDMDDRILDMNPAAQTLFKMDNLVPAHTALQEFFRPLYEQMVTHRQPHPVEVEISFAMDTQEKDWILRLFPLLGRNKRQIGWLMILNDITDRKNVEIALKESERIQRIMLDASPNPIVYYGEKEEVTYLNPAFTRVFGWHLHELIGKKIDFIPKENPEQGTMQKYKHQGHHGFITRRLTKTGDILDVSINSALVRTKYKSPYRVVVNITDITQIKRTERELINTKNYIKSIINSMPSILIGLDAQGAVTQWNAEAENLTGILSEKAEGCLLNHVFPQLAAHICNIETIIENQKVRKETKVVLSMGTQTLLTDIIIYPILSESISGVVIRVDDISERVRMEEMMVMSEKMLSIGGLAAGMAHEINNPLAGILQNTQVIRNRLSKSLPENIKTAEACGINFEKLQAYMEKRQIFPLMDLVKFSGYQAARIVENMLSFSRKSDHRKTLHHLNEIMEATIELVKNDYSMKKQYDFRSIDIIRQYQDHVPAVPCEKSQIQQVFLNILKNGAEAMAEAKILSPGFVIRHYQKADQVVMEIQDNGPGMDHEIKKRIFEPFFTTKQVGLGTGLGLSVSYFIITENHNGGLAVDSTPGKGTVFIITLPILE